MEHETSVWLVNSGFITRPVLRCGLPSHLQSEIHNPDNLTEEQICEGGKYRAVIVSECTGLFVAGAMYWSRANRRWFYYSGGMSKMTSSETLRLPATVPWPDWERKGEVWDEDVKAYVATGFIDSPAQAREIIAAKDARIAELEEEVKFISDLLETKQKMLEIVANSCGKSTSPWRRMSEVPTEEDADKDGYVITIDERRAFHYWRISLWHKLTSTQAIAWMPVPKFHGWPDPLADLLKAHGVAVTPELTAALSAWKGVEK